jgi:hypothetical protein
MADEELLNYLEELGIETVEQFDDYISIEVDIEIAAQAERPSVCTFCGGNLLDRTLPSEFGRLVKMRICEDCSAIVEWYDQTV